MGIYFNTDAINKLSGEQVAELNKLADAAAAQNIDEQDAAEKEAVKKYVEAYKQKEADAAARQKELISTFV